MKRIDSYKIDIFTSQVCGTGIYLLSRSIFFQFLLASTFNFLGTFIVLIPVVIVFLIEGNLSSCYELLVQLYFIITIILQMYIIYAVLVAFLLGCKGNAFYDTWNNHFIINNKEFDIKEITFHPLLALIRFMPYPEGFCILSFKLSDNKVINTLHVGMINKTVMRSLSNYELKINALSILILLFGFIFIIGTSYIIGSNYLF